MSAFTLTRRQREVLEWLRDRADALERGEEEEYTTLDWFTPGGWYVGPDRLRPETGLVLLRACLVSEDHDGDDCLTSYRINVEGRKVLEDPTYVPLAVRHLRGELSAAEVSRMVPGRG